MSVEIFAQLLGELQGLIRDTRTRVAAAIVECTSHNDIVVTQLSVTGAEKIVAAQACDALQRWADNLSGLLHRRGASSAAGLLSHLRDRLKPFVGLSLIYDGDVDEATWRARFEVDLDACSGTVLRLLGKFEELIAFGAPPPKVYMPLDVTVSRVDLENCRLESTLGTEIVRIPAALRTVSRDSSTETLADIGQKLFDWLFVGVIGESYRKARNDAFQNGDGLRIHLHSNVTGEFASIPWESLRDGRQFLALSSHTSIARGFGTADSDVRCSFSPIRILLTMSLPHSLPYLDIEEERALFEAAIGPLVSLGQVEFEVTDDGSLDTVRRTLQRARALNRPFHVWHFVGHGDFDTEINHSCLVMTDSRERPHFVGGWQLSELFAEHPSIRLVVLNACDGAHIDYERPMTSIATALGRVGVSAVIAMQFPIADFAAAMFSAEFYGALCDGAGLDDAVAEARRGLYFSFLSADWIAPVLYTSGATICLR